MRLFTWMRAVPTLACPNGLRRLPIFLLTATLAFPATAATTDTRGIEFFSFDRFGDFGTGVGTNNRQRLLTSPIIAPRGDWQELIVSWNAITPSATGLRVEVRAFMGERATRFFTLGVWASDATGHPRESVRGQQDDDGKVDTDTLILERPARRFEIRLTLTGGTNWPELKYLCASTLNPHLRLEPLAPNQSAWGTTLPVPERSQMLYEGGEAWCSPTTISMLLGFWSEKLQRPELDHLTPAVVKAVFDPRWDGTGNWVFNTAFAGSLPGMRACTVRLSDLAEVEAWIAHGYPVGLSLCYNRLRAKSREPSGHLVVLVGFTPKGDAIINDPGTRLNVRKVFARAQVVDAWGYSKNAAYLVYPVGATLPPDRWGHWGGPRP